MSDHERGRRAIVVPAFSKPINFHLLPVHGPLSELSRTSDYYTRGVHAQNRSFQKAASVVSRWYSRVPYPLDPIPVVMAVAPTIAYLGKHVKILVLCCLRSIYRSCGFRRAMKCITPFAGTSSRTMVRDLKRSPQYVPRKIADPGVKLRSHVR